MRIRNLTVKISVFFTFLSLSACMRTDYTGNWKTSIGDLDLTYHFKMESYELDIINRLDSSQKQKFRGGLYIAGDTMTFVQTNFFNYGKNNWETEEVPKIRAVYKVSGNFMTLTYDQQNRSSLTRIP